MQTEMSLNAGTGARLSLSPFRGIRSPRHSYFQKMAENGDWGSCAAGSAQILSLDGSGI
jgi:hypothetical protein